MQVMEGTVKEAKGLLLLVFVSGGCSEQQHPGKKTQWRENILLKTLRIQPVRITKAASVSKRGRPASSSAEVWRRGTVVPGNPTGVSI